MADHRKVTPALLQAKVSRCTEGSVHTNSHACTPPSFPCSCSCRALNGSGQATGAASSGHGSYGAGGGAGAHPSSTTMGLNVVNQLKLKQTLKQEASRLYELQQSVQAEKAARLAAEKKVCEGRSERVVVWCHTHTHMHESYVLTSDRPRPPGPALPPSLTAGCHPVARTTQDGSQDCRVPTPSK